MPLHEPYMNAYRQFFKNGSKSLSDYRNEIKKHAVSVGLVKKPKVFWYVSNCMTRSRREDYVAELAKHIDIDIFGKCTSNFPNIKSDPCQVNDTEACYIDLYRSYKFYLAFENSFCNNYITEKYWKIYKANYLFNTDVVPVVRGAKNADYELLSYDKSKKVFINAESFPSPKALADYLLELDRNHTEYAGYFEWKVKLAESFESTIRGSNNRVKFLDFAISPFCEVCAKLHDASYMNNRSNRVVKISQWFNPASECWDNPYPIGLFEKVAKFFGFCV
jgi:hypothetical protein